ncbi:IucA/IucC family siderophore biosynthesis protein [Halogeometricum sp. S3BR5-2]|uniref:IucA/IucC family siderophore biosynthesis protein n=1 Tax=Halogeometricum luteum TaxID=2950537 RepID=A0ABU2G2U1_9EURY|nr:IucA/IucC family protein [Halogeometricum sp. S3BR5-2]MDS0295094.1 IucA/IucC family siderophore biosynthesis protein [Halogeometricum sp. S3BR5-2]
MDPAGRADDATVHAFLNCYLRETGAYEVLEGDGAGAAGVEPGPDGLLRARLPAQGVDILAPLSYRSPTERHLFETPVRYRLPGGGGDGGDGEGDAHPADAATLAALVATDLSLSRSGDSETDELLARVLRSERAVESFVAARAGDEERLYGENGEGVTFRDAEQALVFGHHRHPTPKSREGIAERNRGTYAPELRGSFPLDYFRADPALVSSESALDRSAASWVRADLRADPAVPESFVDEHVESGDALLPVHPWQADYLLDRPRVRRHLGDGLEHLGAVGREFYPTTSVRTLYSPDAPFMVKSSMNVAITNSVRTNKRPELERGVAVAELLDTAFGDELREAFPAFDVVRDPAYLALDVGEGAESGVETILRANPFRGERAERSTPVVSLCQDAIRGRSRLGRLVSSIAEREGRSADATSEEWFRRYLEVGIRPILWLYLERGVGVEAHQQNSVLTLDAEGYPSEFRYRDNQGFYFPESRYDAVDAYLPGVGERADTVCADAIADERLRYYVVLNNAFDVINAFGSAGLVDERRLLGLLHDELERARERYGHPDSEFLDPLLESPTVPCKANLLTRFRGLDELENELESQSVYADVTNPLVTELDR